MRHSCVLTVVALLTVSTLDAQTVREVTDNPRSVVRVNAKLRFTTLIVLPEGEQILDFVCGDKDFWVVSGAEHLAYVKPAKAGAETNLNLVTASGHVYSFLLTEGSGEPDLKLYVLADQPTLGSSSGPPRFYPARQVEDLRREADEARTEMEATKSREAQVVEEAIAGFRTAYATELRFPYRYKAHEKPFSVSAIFHDGAFTYIRADATELPALYEMRDGMPNLVHFQVEHGTYVVPKVLERGYLVIGNQRFSFESR